MPIITFVVGDWSADGHGMTDKIAFQSNLSSHKIEEAYKAGSKKLGFDFIEDVACDYEDGRIHWDELSTLRKAGFTQELDDETTKEEAQQIKEKWENDHPHVKCRDYAGASLDPETYINIYQFIVKLGNPKASFKKLKKQTLEIGGYGLFRN